jgi:hypothetical protein
MWAVFLVCLAGLISGMHSPGKGPGLVSNVMLVILNHLGLDFRTMQARAQRPELASICLVRLSSVAVFFAK